MNINPLTIKPLSRPLPLKSIIGPSFIILGLGLGSGEIVLWPYLTSNFGLGIIWGAIIGLTFQFIINMEIERYTLSTGESVFVGLTRKLSWIPLWFIASTFLPWIWPGIVASSAKFIGSVFNFPDTQLLAIFLLILIGIILSIGPLIYNRFARSKLHAVSLRDRSLYKTVEGFQKILIIIGVPSIFLLAIYFAKQNHWLDLARGVVGIGDGYLFLPVGISIASFLAALAYSGTGGNLNLSQSFYIKEKGYGMGRFGAKVGNLIKNSHSDETTLDLSGAKFESTSENLASFNSWWKKVNIEHFIIFWLTGSVTILMLALLAYATTYGKGLEVSGINFVLSEAGQISGATLPVVGSFFLLIAGLTLFGTQLTVLDATSRILTENLVLISPKKIISKTSHAYYIVLWLQIMAGILVFLLGFKEPLQLLTIAAILNAIAMFIHTAFTLWLNLSTLDKDLRPSLFRITAVILALLFYGGFSIYVITDTIRQVIT